MFAVFPLEPTLFLMTMGVIGLVIGSFISLISWRLPRTLDLEAEDQLKLIALGRSKCPECDQTIPWYKLVPVFSWLISNKCHHCKTKIHWRYPLIELSTFGLTLLFAWLYGQNWTLVAALIFTWMLITISVIDIEHHLILDKLSLPLLWLGLIINTETLFTSPSDAILGAVFGYLFLWVIYQAFRLITGKEGMGFGDFKLLAALGAWFGVSSLAPIILVASISSLVIGLLGVVFKLRKLDDPLAFGPFLALAGLLYLLVLA